MSPPRSPSEQPSGTTRASCFSSNAADSGVWLYPTGWADVGYSAAEVVVKEVLEETGIEAEPLRLIAVLDGLRLGFSTRASLFVGVPLQGHRGHPPGPPPRMRGRRVVLARRASPSPWPGPSAGGATCSRRCGASISTCSSTRCARRSGAGIPARDEAVRSRRSAPTSAVNRPVGSPVDSPVGSPASSGIGLVVVVEEVLQVTPELVEAFGRFIPQLSSSSPPADRDELAAIVSSDAGFLFVARDGSGRIVGTLTLAVFRIPTGVRAWIEDVVVDGAAHGAGAAGSWSGPPSSVPRPSARRRSTSPRAEPRGGQPALPADGLRGPQHQRVPVRPRGVTVPGVGAPGGRGSPGLGFAGARVRRFRSPKVRPRCRRRCRSGPRRPVPNPRTGHRRS